MVTRVYFPNSTTAPAPPAGVTPAAAPLWDQAAAPTYRALPVQAETVSTSGGTFSVPARAAAFGTTSNIYGATFVSLSTFRYARTVTGTVTGVLTINEAAATNDLFWQVVVRVIASDGSIRGTLLNGITNTIELSTTASSRLFNAETLTPVDVQPGDRLVVEWGVRSASTATTAGAVTMRPNSNTGTADLAFTNGALTGLRPWLEFDSDLFALQAITGTTDLTLPRFGATVAGTRTLPTTGTLATGMRPLSATLAGTARPPGVSGPLALTLPPLGGALAGTSTPPPRSGAVAAALPAFGAALQGYAPPATSTALAATLPTLGVALQGHVAGNFNTLAATLPAFTADLAGAVPVIYRTDTTWRNDGHRHVSRATVDYDPPVVAPPPHLHRQDVRRVHQSLPTPTIVKGRPQ